MEPNKKELKKEVATLYGTCIECKQPRRHYQWCQPCERKQCVENFKNWTSGDERIDKFLQDAQFCSTRPQTYLEWIPFDKLGNINVLNTNSGNKTSTVYSAIWKDGPRIMWDQRNEKYERAETKVTIVNKDGDDNDQINEILNELKIYVDCHTQDNALLIQFYGISKHPVSNDYFIVKQFHENTSSLSDYISHNFNNLNWEMKLHLLLYLAEDLKALHNAGYVHRYFKNPSSVQVLGDNFCVIETFLECKALSLSNKDEKDGWYPYKAPEILINQPYTKASDIFSFGMIMHAIGTGKIPPYIYPLHFSRCLTFDICSGLRPHIPNNIPKNFKNLVEICWNNEPILRPNIHEVHNVLLNLWSSIYHNKYPTTLNLICLEFLAADNNKDYSESKFQEIIPQKAESDNLEQIDIIRTIKRFVKFIKMDELTTKTPISSKISRYTYTLKEKTLLVVCKRLNNDKLVGNESIKAFIHKLNVQDKLGFRSRIMRILGICFDQSANEYLLVMQYADGGNLRQYLNNHLIRLTWNDKIKLAYQITEGIKYLHDEDILHQNLYPKNILIHKEEAKITLNIGKEDTEISYIDPKLLGDDSYEYDKKSDIYSLGVLMWEITSGHLPFIYIETENLLKMHLINDLREKPIPNTPNEYLDLYKSCWDSESNKRPSVSQVFDILGKILYSAQTKKNFEPTELINLIKNNHLTRIIEIDELSEVNNNVDRETILTATWKNTNCLNYANLGICLDENTNEYLLIIQYADGGNLRQYLKNHLGKLTWNNKIKLAHQITEGIRYLHDKDIIHQNLYYKNILIHKKEAKIKLDIIKNTAMNVSDEIISYVDPKLLGNTNEYRYRYSIYSLGVLLWELSGCYPETRSIMNCYPGTPNEYLNLYKSCWDSEPSKRPSISQVSSKLEEMNKNLGPELINLIIEQNLFKFIDKSELTDVQNFDAGHFGIISRAIWKKTNNNVVCKKLRNNESISNKPIEAFLHELKMYRRLDFCERIIRILGISLDESTKEYLFVMQYADSGNLREYLKNRVSTLTWEDKIKLSYQITDGIKFLQGENILHRDLHSGNIVIHQGEAKIIDLGIAKSIETQTNIHSNVFGSLPYIDPKRLDDPFYEYNEKSDIYSLGVLMWEISSCTPPFINDISESLLRIDLINGRRENPVPDTPEVYLKLYKLCWDINPDKRPTISEVYNKIVKLGRMKDIQYFQDIECDDDGNEYDIQDLQNIENIQVDNNAQLATKSNINDAGLQNIRDIQDDYNIQSTRLNINCATDHNDDCVLSDDNDK
ncbi:kinase-like domain-containing protein [Rhizophagus clarus]|uniref:Kinase-like domain-containing protein n=1 Tax=Rhizophagus clarus TaxID=94130 RepID=A0A8H3KVY1_9GLOM|nr:kinase-like domain-containing protein [Rhizophagus clarus]